MLVLPRGKSCAETILFLVKHNQLNGFVVSKIGQDNGLECSVCKGQGFVVRISLTVPTMQTKSCLQLASAETMTTFIQASHTEPLQMSTKQFMCSEFVM